YSCNNKTLPTSIWELYFIFLFYDFLVFRISTTIIALWNYLIHDADVHAIKFQKRGLSHAHLLSFLSAEDKIHSTSQIDSVISAEILDSITDPQCYVAVTNMFHGPCEALGPSAPCTI
ncbi:hypothetical protein LINPERHAP2_LOCUS24448, partial [Linum perenne]